MPVDAPQRFPLSIPEKEAELQVFTEKVSILLQSPENIQLCLRYDLCGVENSPGDYFRAGRGREAALHSKA